MRSNVLKVTRSRLKEKVLACCIPIASMYGIFRYTCTVHGHGSYVIYITRTFLIFEGYGLGFRTVFLPKTHSM